MMNCGKAQGDKVRVRVAEGGGEGQERNRVQGVSWGGAALPKQECELRELTPFSKTITYQPLLLRVCMAGHQ